MAEDRNRNNHKKLGFWGIQRKWLLLALAGVAVLIIVIFLVLLLTDRDDADGSLTSDTADSGATEVTSPYDFTELPVGSGPGDVDDTSYVSILLVDDTGQLTSYGMNADMPEAQALHAAVLEAEEVDSDLLSSLTTTPPAGSVAGVQLGSTLTFVFPDRTTLTFDLYVEQGFIGRDGRAWHVESGLAELIEAAASAGGL